jgi:F0F1-type ATP synthase membrane subunit a
MVCFAVANFAGLTASIALEVMSVGFRSVSLGFRFLANVAAGHVLGDLVTATRYNVCMNLFC